MKLFNLPIHPTRVLPPTTWISMAAGSLGFTPIHNSAVPLLAFALLILFLKFKKGHTLSFAFQTLTGIASHRQIDALKSHIPAPIREQIESGDFDFSKRVILNRAAIGVVEIFASAQISNLYGLTYDYKVKEKFHKAAALRARQFSMLILNRSGDGFSFLMNYGEQPEWRQNLVSFYVALSADFQAILCALESGAGINVQSGLRFGVSYGNVMLGCMTEDPANFIATGSDVNLAAQMCHAGEVNDLVFSESAWTQVKAIFSTIDKKFQTHSLKDFSRPVTGVHINRNRFIARQNHKAVSSM